MLRVSKQPDFMPSITLSGCAPVPLAHYLKALGILRLVAEQADERATAHWIGNQFVLKSRFAQEHEPNLAEFFRRDYRPTPIVVPWSGGDFFAVNREKPAKSFGKTPTSACVIEAILSTNASRLDDYRRALLVTFAAMDKAGVMKKKDIEGSGGPQRRMKAEMLRSLRSSLPDGALAWLDAAAVIEPEAVAFNTLLGGGGGSDGNSHFSDNFMQCLWMVLPEFDTQREKSMKAIGKDAVFDSCTALKESLYGIQGAGTKISGLSPVLFDSMRVGGPNQTNGFEAKAGSNPWDFIFMLEGSILFAGAIGRKLEDHQDPSARFPFLFQASPVGLGSSYLGESAGREMWLPLWSNHTTLAEIRFLLAEGRVEKHGRMAEQIHKQLCRDDISKGHPVFTGGEASGHQHAYIFCESIDDTNAHITHVTIYCPAGFDEVARLALRKVQWSPGFKGHDLRLVLHGIGSPADFADCQLFGTATKWCSLTPFVSTRHAKTFRDGRPKMDTTGWQIGSPAHDLLRLLGLHPHGAAASVKLLDERERPFQFGNRSLRSLQFQTTRYNGNGHRGSSSGNAFIITFPEPVCGPLAFGYGAHFGLGLFVPLLE